MARRKRGQPVHGWLILDKPAGVSSAAAVAKAKWALNAQKAGHAGTLDPSATGLLAIAFGEATKTVPYIMDARKEYRFTVRWGAATNTDDAEGEIIAESRHRPSRDQIEAALPGFRGEIKQVPPKFSAIKIDGQRAYSLARAGQSPEIASRPLFVRRLELVDMPDPDTAVLEMECGKGGYVRSMGRDLGRKLGCLGHVVTLRRTSSGPFDLSTALTWETLEQEARDPVLQDRLAPVEAGLFGVTMVDCSESDSGLLANGNPVRMSVPAGTTENTLMWVRANDRPLAIGRWSGGLFRPDRVFVFTDTG